MNKVFDKPIVIESIAGEVLEKSFTADDKSKSIAGSLLKCAGDKGIPSFEIIDKAKQVTANANSKKLYSDKVIILAEYALKKYGKLF